MFFIVILLVGVAYILTGASNIIKTEETIGAIVTSSAIGLVLGWLISSLFGQQAIRDGFNDLDLINAQNSQAKEIESIDKDIDKLDIYCDKENEITMVRKRTRILKRVGIKYSQFENEDYGQLKLTRRRKRAIRKANDIGFGYLTSDWLLADLDEEDERNTKRISIRSYETKQNISNILTKTFTGIFSGLYVLEPFAKFNWAIVIWRLFFFALWIIFGVVRYEVDFGFMTKDYRKSIVNKTNYIIKFKNSLTQHPDWYKINETLEKDEVKQEYEQPIQQILHKEPTTNPTV
jgi:hypothetical protein